MTADPNDAPLVSVFVIDNPALAPLAEMVLKQEDIDYAIRDVGSLAPVLLNQPDRPVLGLGGGAEVFVRKDDADRARTLLEELQHAPLSEGGDLDDVAMRAVEPTPPPPSANIVVYDDDANVVIGRITEAQLEFLDDHLEEESASDTDYFINVETIDMLEAAGGDPALVAMLRQALGVRADMTISWQAE